MDYIINFWQYFDQVFKISVGELIEDNLFVTKLKREKMKLKYNLNI